MSPRVSTSRFAFPAMLAGSTSLAFGPWLVRLADVGPLASGFWRLAIAAPVLFVLCGLGRQRFIKIDRAIFFAIVIAGAAFAADLAVWHEGILRTNLTNSTLVGNMSAFAFAGWGFLVARKLPGRNAALALLLALAGVLLLMGRSYQLNPSHLIGDLLCLLAALFYTIYLIVIGNLRTRIAPLPTMALVTVAGAAFALVVTVTGEGDIWPRDWTPLLVLALSSQVIGQGLVAYAVVYLEPIAVGLCLLVQPVISGMVGWVFYNERLGPLEFMGALMIAVALVLVRRPDRTGFPAAADRLSATQD